MPDNNTLRETASQVRRDIIRMVNGVKSGHPGGSLGCADLLTALYFEVMEHDPKKFDMDALDQDVFILSNGHISPVFYSCLARSGYFPIEELSTFRRINFKGSRTSCYYRRTSWSKSSIRIFRSRTFIFHWYCKS